MIQDIKAESEGTAITRALKTPRPRTGRSHMQLVDSDKKTRKQRKAAQLELSFRQQNGLGLNGSLSPALLAHLNESNRQARELRATDR